MRTLVIVLVSLVGFACGPGSSDDGQEPGAPPDTTEDLPRAQGPQSLEQRLESPMVAQLWTGVMDSIAPDDGWDRTRYVRFDWMVNRDEGDPVRRSHWWDRESGRYRVEASVDAGELVALFNVDHPTDGERVWLDGEAVPDGARSDSLVERAHSMFINDSYWLLFPFKWADPGVETHYAGEAEVWGESYEVVELTFRDVGLTPQNRYRAYIDPETGMFELWQFFRNAQDTVPGFTNRWTDWQRYGPILLSSRRENREGVSGIYFENLDAATEVPAGVFEPPEG